MQQEFNARKIGEMKPFLLNLSRSIKEFGLLFVNIWKVVSNFVGIMWSKLQWLIINYPRSFAAGQFIVLVLSCGYCFVVNRFQDNNFSRQLYLQSEQRERENGISYAKGYEQCMRDNRAKTEELEKQMAKMRQAEKDRIDAERAKAVAKAKAKAAAIAKEETNRE